MIFIYIIVLLSIIFGIFTGLRDYTTRNKLIEENLYTVNQFFEEIEEGKKDYFTHSKKKFIQDNQNYKEAYHTLSKESIDNIKNQDIINFIDVYPNLDNLVKKWNEDYISNELEYNSNLFDNIDGKSLDEQQRRAVIVDEDNDLVIAGAGSGKTLTISGKVKYLVDVKNIKPEEILLISFTKKAAGEMSERIAKKLKINVKSKTFHKLGYDIINMKNGKGVEVFTEIDKFISDYFKRTSIEDLDLEKLMKFYGCYMNIPKDINEFETLGEYYKYCKSLELDTIKDKYKIAKANKTNEEDLKKSKKTLRGEQVKSIEEVMIANYLFLNGIDYEYEQKYPYDDEHNYRKVYRPDFYLPQYDIYIEHFGINKDFKAPWLSEILEKEYIEGIRWKRELHKKNNTTLIETYSYYNKEGILLSELKKKLITLGVQFKKVDCKNIFMTIASNEEDQYFKEFRKLISTFIEIFKSKGYKKEDFDRISYEIKKTKSKFLRERNLIFLDIVKPIYIKYEDMLHSQNKIDFNDMLIEATNIIKNNEVKFNYKYIIIDEYQDISINKFELIKEIKQQTNAKLMCVGDDWQSIYRFAGSDLDLFTNFEKYVGYYELLKIEKTYRNSQQLIDIASNFIMENNNQIKKNLKSDKIINSPINMISYSHDISNTVKNVLEEIYEEFGQSTVAILGRNNSDIKMLADDDFKINRNQGDISIKYKNCEELKIKYLTVHKSKGLESDNIIIINLRNKISGFPNQMFDDPVLDLIMPKSEKFEFAEERRLFYVALTRTKNKTYLIVPKLDASIFCDELKSKFHIKYKYLEKSNTNKVLKCPKCKGGILVKKNGINGKDFLSCSNYPMCDFTTNNIEILDNPIICDKCGAYMVKRISSKSGEAFLGCINYPRCKNKKEYIETKERSNCVDSKKQLELLNEYKNMIMNHNYDDREVDEEAYPILKKDDIL